MIKNSPESVVTTRKCRNVVDFLSLHLIRKMEQNIWSTSANSDTPSRHNVTHVLLVGLE